MAQRIPEYRLYGEAPGRTSESMLHIETIEARSADHHWKIKPHRHHALHQIVFVLRGGGVVLADGQRSQYRAPAIAMVPAGAVHGFDFEPGTKGHVISISIHVLREISQREPGLAGLFVHPATVELRRGALHATNISQSIRMFATEFARPDARSGLALHGWMQVLLGNLLRLTRGLATAADTPAGQRRKLVARFEELVEHNFRKRQSIASFASALHVSESSLRNACLDATGLTPIQLIHTRILLEAKRELKYTDNKVGEVGYALGFEDAAHFSRFFARLAGDSPRAFRKDGAERV